MNDSFDELGFLHAGHVLVTAEELGQCEHVAIFERRKDSRCPARQGAGTASR
jgi:hypothetical protein